MAYRRMRRRTYGRGRKYFKKRALRQLAAPARPRALACGILNDGTGVLHDNKQFYAHECTSIPQGNQPLGSRDGNTILFKGVRLRIMYENPTTDPVYMNMALISHGAVSMASYSGLTGPPDFFRNLNGSNHSDAGLSWNNIGLTINDYRSLPINNRKYTVLWHYRKNLGPKDFTGNFASGFMPSAGRIDRYIKINKRIAYESNNSESAETKITLCYWFTIHGTNTTVNSACRLQRQIVSYFRDIVQ